MGGRRIKDKMNKYQYTENFDKDEYPGKHIYKD